jgi:hypothetical protein
MSESQKANLARIRDNQRRSRARRKEYLQELETKYRICEQIGAEASAEIQSAARRVLDENKKLRTLLKSRGMSDMEIDGFMGVKESLSQGDSKTSLPSEHLKSLVSARKPCCPGNISCGPSTMFDSEDGALSPPLEKPLLQPLQTTNPEPSVVPSPTLPNNLSTSSNTQPTPSAPEPILYTPTAYLALALEQPDTIPNQASYQYIYPNQIDSHWQPYDMQQEPQHTSTAPDFGNTSCVDAASIIRNMRIDIGPELESDLGCQQDGVECKVENSVVFDVMEKYTT